MITRRALLAGLPGCMAASQAEAPWASRHAALSPDFHRGVNLAHLHRRGWGYGSERAAAQLDHLRTLGVRHLALNPFAYTSSLASTDIRFDGDDTLTDADLRAQVEQATARGITVMMKPHLWSRSFWTGKGNTDIRPDDWAAWFASYTRYAVHYAALAEATGCGWMCVGLEYTHASRENPGAWARVADACREVFRGKLVYAANWYEEYEVFRDWGSFDAIGIDAYFPLQGTRVDELAKSWEPHLDAIAKVAKGRPVIFTEAGYRARAGATREPWSESGGAADPDLQARAYEALMRACAARPWFAGVYWWKSFTAGGGESEAYGRIAGDDDFVPTPVAEKVVSAWFGA